MPNLGPIPGAAYASGTMSTADIYPTHVGIGGVRTQDRALPAFADAVEAQATGSLTRTGLDSELLGEPAGWLFLLFLVLAVAPWVMKRVT